MAIGYGVQKKSDVTGATVSVSAEELTSRPVTNAVAAMQGKAAGIDISSNERPGTVGSISIRGVRSLTASNTPLYVVDGIPLVSSTADIQGDDNNRITSYNVCYTKLLRKSVVSLLTFLNGKLTTVSNVTNVLTFVLTLRFVRS